MSPHVHFGTFVDPLSYPSTLLADVAVNTGAEVSSHCYPDGVDEGAVDRQLAHARPDVVALSFMLFNRDDAFTVARVARRRGLKVIAGGPHPTTCPEDLEASGLFDAIVQGDGVGLFEELLNRVDSLDGQVLQGRAHPDPAAYFRRHLLPAQRRLLSEQRSIDLFTSIGCPFSCAFCSKTVEHSRSLPLELAVDYLGWARDRFEIQRAEVWDEIFAMNHGRLRRFRALLRERQIEIAFTAYAHAKLFDDRIAEQLAEIGVDALWFGIETAAPHLLTFLDKRFTVAQAEAAARRCRRHGLPFNAYLMAGLPTQTTEDYALTLRFIERTQPDEVSVTFFMPFPGSPLFRYCIEHGYMPADWSFDHYLEGEPAEAYPGVKTYGGLQRIDYRAAVEFQQAVHAWQQQRD